MSAEQSKPLAIDLFCGLGGWTEGFLAEGYRVRGYDIEAHDYGTGGYPGELILRDVLSIHGSEFADAAVIVASPPCQAYSYRAMPWSRAKALPPPDNSLFEACFRIQREASDAAGRRIPLIVENVRGAERWVGPAQWHFGSFYLWGDVPALMPVIRKAAKVPGYRFDGSSKSFQAASVEHTKNSGGSWFAIGSPNQSVTGNNPVSEGQKLSRHINQRNGHSHTRHLTNPREHAGVKFSQTGAAWFDGKPRDKMLGDKSPAAHGSGSLSRKAASAMIAKIPLALSRHIAQVYYPKEEESADGAE